MPWRLAFDGVNDHCTFTTAASVNLGADAYSFECALLLSTLPASGLYGIIGRNGTATGFAVTSDGRLAMYGAGILRYQTSAGLFLADSAQHVYRLEHDAGGAWRVYRDNLTTPIESGTYTTSTSAAGMNRIGTSTGGAGWLLGELAYVDLQIPVGSQRWDANLSGGTGSTLPTVSGTNQGTLVNFTVPDCWVFYSTGDSLAFSGTLPRLTAAISAIVTNSIDASFSGTLPKLTTAISADVTYGIRASFAGALPKLQASINATVSTGTDSLSFSGALPKLAASISATISAPPNSLAFAGIMPKLQVSISAVVSLPPPLVAFSGALPRLRMQAAMIIQVPEPAGDPLALKQALVNARRAEENRNNEYVPPVVIVPEWYIIQQRALGLKQVEVNRARDEE